MANRLANLIVEAETHFNLEINDEVIIDEIEENNTYEFDTNQSDDENLSSYLDDEVFKEADFFRDIMETDAQSRKEESKRNIRNTLEKVSKIPVAPGESGKFKNWGEDVFLEEKCFPDMFPFGVGGYLSALVNQT